MGAAFIWRCDKCGHTVRTNGPWEFYRDKNGKRKFFGHPFPVSEEAVEAGIAGLSAVLYCPVCDRTTNRIIVEYETPTDELSVWIDGVKPQDKYLKPDAVKCRKCGNSKLLLDEAGVEVQCPKCGEGKLHCAMEWIS